MQQQRNCSGLLLCFVPTATAFSRIFEYENSIRILTALFEYLKLFEYCQKLLILDPSHYLVQFSIVQGKIVPRFQLILHASRV